MKVEKWTKEAFAVIGKEGSTEDGAGFVQRLWEAANRHFQEIASLARRDEDGNFVGFWGAMTDCSRAFLPWEDDFSRGLYLAGAECEEDAEAPSGWRKWTVPGFVYLRAECAGENLFPEMIDWLSEHQIPLVGAVQEYTCPKTGISYMCFPIEKL